MNMEPQWPWRLMLRDVNPDMVMAWCEAFADEGPWSVGSGNILQEKADAIVSPANSYGYMDGGIDLAYRNHFGLGIQNRLQQYLQRHHHGFLPVGEAIVLPTMNERIPLMLVAPTMERPMDVSTTQNAYIATRAALQRIRLHNVAAREQSGQVIRRVLMPGMATGIGGMPVDDCAAQMRQAVNEELLEAHRK